MTPLTRTAVAAAVLAAAGCGGGTTEVAGTVRFDGKPVVYGTVVVVGSDGLPKSGDIRPDGTFRVSGVRVGPAKVAVTSPRPPGSEPPRKARGRDDDGDKPPPPAAPPAPPEVIRAWVPLPEKYGDPGTSGLTADVKPGQPLDLVLK